MINLIPEVTRINKRYALRNTRLIRYTVVSIFTMVSIMVITGISILGMKSTEGDLRKQADEENSKLASYKPLQAQGQALSEQITTINTLLGRQVEFSSLLPEIAKIMPQGAVLKQLNLSSSDILPAGSTVTPSAGTSPSSSQQKPFVILAAVKDRSTAATLLENVKASKELFTDADIVDVSQNSKGGSTDANSTPSTTIKYPYQVTINAYLKKQTAASSASKTGGNK
jgi:hypothetical protein